MSPETFRLICYVWLSIAVITFVSLFFRTAPYGRHTQSGWGALIPNRFGWIIMESPAVMIMLYFWWTGACCGSYTALAFLFLWQLHYVYRAFLYPFRLPNQNRMMPLSVAMMGATFQLVNASLNGYWLFSVGEYSNAWLLSPAFLFGAGLFLLGMSINHHADDVLLSLRRPGDTEYRIPEGGLYRYISCPNYFGEILEWCGWAIATWSLCGFTFAFWTIANLAPRAIAHHKWYQEKFSEYPAERRAIIPFLW
jgi:3-oxo-5-alpha-steroid 4-dehydrogenase 1